MESLLLMSQENSAGSDSPQRLLKLMSLLQQKHEATPLTISQLFHQIIELSRKGHPFYGFKTGKWISGNQEFTLSSDGFISDLGLLETLAYIQIDKLRETIQLLPPGENASGRVKLEEPIMSLLKR